MSKRKLVAVTDDRYGDYSIERKVLEEIDAELIIFNLSDESEGRNKLSAMDALLVNLFPLNNTVIDSLTHCRVISRYGVGYDNVDVAAATKKSIWVANVPDYSIEDVSDQALALLLGCIRKVAYKDRQIRKGNWNLHKHQPCFRIKNKTLGLIGFGAIARAVLKKMQGFGLSRVLVFDPFIDAEVIEERHAEKSDLNSLLSEADYISLHVPLLKETKNLIGKNEISIMKKGAILINTSRGPILDESALCDSLAANHLAGAGLDVFTEEPLPAPSPLRSFDTVILSDHAGWYSEESMVELKTKAAQNIVSVFNQGKPIYPVTRIYK